MVDLQEQTMEFPDQTHRRVKPFSQELDETRVKLAAHILRKPNSDPLRQVSYQPDSAEPIHIGKRRVSGPRHNVFFFNIFNIEIYYGQRNKEAYETMHSAEACFVQLQFLVTKCLKREKQ